MTDKHPYGTKGANSLCTVQGTHKLVYLFIILLMYWLYAVNLMSSSTLHSGLKDGGGMTLARPKGSASRRMDSRYLMGSRNSFSVGRYTGASTR